MSQFGTSTQNKRSDQIKKNVVQNKDSSESTLPAQLQKSLGNRSLVQLFLSKTSMPMQQNQGMQETLQSKNSQLVQRIAQLSDKNPKMSGLEDQDEDMGGDFDEEDEYGDEEEEKCDSGGEMEEDKEEEESNEIDMEEDQSSSEEEEESSSEEEDSDDDYEPPQPKDGRPRYTFSKQTRSTVIKNTALRNKSRLYVCPACGRGLADPKGNEIKTYYTSKSKKRHNRVACDLDHYPKTWAQIHDDLKKNGASESEIKTAYSKHSSLRAMCHVCNQSHKLEGKKLKDSGYTDEEYESPDEDRDDEIWKKFRKDDDEDDDGAGMGGSSGIKA